MRRRLEVRGEPGRGASEPAPDQALSLALCAARRCRERGPLPEDPGRADEGPGGGRPDEGAAAQTAGSSHPVAVAVVDGDKGVWKAVRTILSASTESQCCGCFRTAAEALEAVPKLAVRIVLVGAVLPDLCGIRCVRELRARQPGLGIILVSDTALDQVMARRVVAAGANLCCLKPLRAEQCLLTLRLVAARFVPEHPGVRLTAREEQILSFLAEGLAYKEIADQLDIGMSLLKKLQQRIFRRLGAHSRVLAVNKWRQGG